MAKLPIYDRTGREVGSVEIDAKSIAPRINRQLLHDAVVMYQANLRQGSVRTKSRSDVSGSTKKMYRQKGTGNARAGSRRSGVRRGGGHIMALRPRDWSYRLPRKALKLATRMAVASKIQDDQFLVIDELVFSEPKTRDVASILQALKIDGATVHIATESHSENNTNVWKSARNIPGVTVSPVDELNALSVLKPRRLLVTQQALASIKAWGEA